MSKKKKNALVPKLRFSQFKSSKEWNVDKFGSLIIPVEERAGTKKYTLMSVTSGIGLIPQIEKFGREIAGNAYKNYYVIKKNDFAYNKSATKLFPEGYISMLKDYKEAALPNSIFTCFRITDDECEPRFFDYLFHNNYHGSWLRKYIEVGARAHGSLNLDTLHLWNMPIALPSLKEQQKIADCLSSLDGLILTEKQKLEFLKSHKKGLMQQLFPEEGKRVPKLRFPGYTGAWEQRKLGDFVNITTGKLDANAMAEDGEFDFYTSGIKKYRIDISAFEGPAITIAGNGATVGYMHLADGKFNAYQRTYVLTDFKADRQFLFSEVGNRLPKKISEEARAGNIPYIVMDMLTELGIKIPSDIDEQKRVGELFIVLDRLITLHQRKLEALNIHKKGLLQGLFPAVEDVSE